MSYLIGIDIGTSGTKTLLVDTRGKRRASVTVEYPSYAPKPAWSEQVPEDWWQAACRSIRLALRKAKVKGPQVAGLGLSGQMHGSVFLDRSGKVLRRAILWNDQRTGAECDATIKTRTKTAPNKKVVARYDALYPEYGRLYRSLRDDFKRIAALHA